VTRDSDAAHQWHLLHRAAMATAMTFRLLPRRRRFAAAQSLARAAGPFFRGTGAYRAQQQANIDGAAEIALHFVTNALTVNGTVFDPVVGIEGYDEFRRLCRGGRGVLLVQPHAVLTHLQFRIFHDDGLDPVGVNADRHMRIAGTTIPAQPLVPSRTFLVRARSLLRDGRLVCAMLDRGEHSADRTVEVETANGPVIVAPALLQVACRCQARVAFTEVHVDRRRVVGRIVLASSDSAEGLTREFGDFVRTHVAARLARAASPTAVAPERLTGAER
jgi:hypothetical protein